MSSISASTLTWHIREKDLPIIVGCLPCESLHETSEQEDISREEAELERLLGGDEKVKNRMDLTESVEIRSKCLEDFAKAYNVETARIDAETRPSTVNIEGQQPQDNLADPAISFVADPPMTKDGPIEAASYWDLLLSPSSKVSDGDVVARDGFVALSCCFPGVGSNGYFGVAFDLSKIFSEDAPTRACPDEPSESDQWMTWLTVLPKLLDSTGSGGRKNTEVASIAREKTLYACTHVESCIR